VRSFTSGKLSVSYAEGSAGTGSSAAALADRAALLLRRAGLLTGRVAV
jgi:hypothetical protein